MVEASFLEELPYLEGLPYLEVASSCLEVEPYLDEAYPLEDHPYLEEPSFLEEVVLSLEDLDLALALEVCALEEEPFRQARQLLCQVLQDLVELADLMA